MKRSALGLATLLCLLLAAHTPSIARDSQAWTSIRSKNFLLVGNASEREIREVATRLEQFRDALTRFFAVPNVNSAVPTTVIVFRSDESYRPFKPLYEGLPSNVAGYFQSGNDLNYITIAIDGNTARPFSTVFHEYVHLFVENNLRGLPLSLNEGLAEYFSTFESSDKGRRVTVGKTNDYHLRILRSREWLPLAELLAADSKSSIYNERDKRDLFYAQSWALAHYLILGRTGERQSDFYRFVDQAAKGTPVVESFKQTFGQEPSSIERELKEYIRRDRRPAQVTAFDKRPEIKGEAMTASPITEAEAQYYLGDLLLHTNRLDEAASYLEEALRLSPELAMASASLGMVRVKQKNFSEAIPLLRRAVALAPENYLAHYYYAYGLSRQGIDEHSVVVGYEPEAAKTMRAEALRAIELSPSYPESYHLLAFINLAMGERLDQAEALLREGLRIAPAREDFAFVLAQIYERKRDWTRAREVLEPLRRSFNAQLRVKAEQMLKNIDSSEEQFKSLEERGMRVPGATSPSDTSGVSANAQTMRLPKRFEGERVRGLLTNVECSNGETVLTIRADNRILRFHSDNLRRITFVAYVQGMGRNITCGQRAPANLVLLTFRPSKPSRGQFDGEAVAIEFVPEDMDFEP